MFKKNGEQIVTNYLDVDDSSERIEKRTQIKYTKCLLSLFVLVRHEDKGR